jgi:hypothetical protein
MATKKLSVALKALTAPEFGAEVEMPSLSLNGTTITPTAAELNFVDGVTSNIQTQLGNKAASSHGHAGADITSGTVDAARLPAFSTVAQGAVPLSTTSTGSQVLADNGWKKINDLYTAFATLTDGTTITWNMAATSYNAKVTLGGDRTLNITNAIDGMSGCLIVKQDGNGNRGLTVPVNSLIINGGGSLPLSSAPNFVDVVTWIYDGTTFYFSVGNNYLAP